jgi:hypothetical protein
MFGWVAAPLNGRGDSSKRRRGAAHQTPSPIFPARKASGLNRKARPAAAAGGGIGVCDLERGATQIVHKVHHAATHKIEAHRIDDERHAIGLHGDVVILGSVSQAEAILETRAAAAFHGEPKNGRLLLPRRNLRDARRFGQRFWRSIMPQKSTA